MPVWFEIKKYGQAYRRILFGMASSVFTCVLLFMGVNALLQRQSLFEPFSIGVVDHDSSPEIRFIFDFFNDAVALDYMEQPEAEAKLQNGEIPAYVELPERFAADIMSGGNTPFRLHGNNDLPLQLAMSKLLAAGGVAFLSSSQAGIYATMDYASAHGLSGEFINRYVLYPVNVAFAKKLIDYQSFFTIQVLPMTTGDVHPAAQYVKMFITFLFMVNLLAFLRTLHGYTPAVYARYRMAGFSLGRVQIIRWAGLFLINAVWMVPVTLAAVRLTGQAFTASVLRTALANSFALAFCVSTFGLMSAALFKNETACGIFIFITALGMLFISGGILPLVFLPGGLHVLRYAAIPFWASEGTVFSALMMAAFGVIFFGVVCVAEFFHTRFPRAV